MIRVPAKPAGIMPQLVDDGRAKCILRLARSFFFSLLIGDESEQLGRPVLPRNHFEKLGRLVDKGRGVGLRAAFRMRENGFKKLKIVVEAANAIFPNRARCTRQGLLRRRHPYGRHLMQLVIIACHNSARIRRAAIDAHAKYRLATAHGYLCYSFRSLSEKTARGSR